MNKIISILVASFFLIVAASASAFDYEDITFDRVSSASPATVRLLWSKSKLPSDGNVPIQVMSIAAVEKYSFTDTVTITVPDKATMFYIQMPNEEMSLYLGSETDDILLRANTDYLFGVR